jgi:hypothetical protein
MLKEFPDFCSEQRQLDLQTDLVVSGCQGRKLGEIGSCFLHLSFHPSIYQAILLYFLRTEHAMLEEFPDFCINRDSRTCTSISWSHVLENEKSGKSNRVCLVYPSIRPSTKQSEDHHKSIFANPFSVHRE